ncbi:MAG TPA: hypothetical protein VME68_00380 [Acidobacteriaceae bacterium]|nr:hypothetical protein [Acidobacteriaceae bacterium]
MDSSAIPSPLLRRPLLVTLLGWMLIALGAVEFACQAARIRPPLQASAFGVPLFELIILVSGVFLLRGHAWARWLAVAWVGFHVAVGSLHSVTRGIVHGAIFLLFTWMMFRPEINAWFRARSQTA